MTKPNPRRYFGKRRQATYAWTATCAGDTLSGIGRTRLRGEGAFDDLLSRLEQSNGVYSVIITSLTRIRG